MIDFNDKEYSSMIGNLIDCFQYSSMSNRSKLAQVRQFSEILVRRILNIGSDKEFMLGQIKKYNKQQLEESRLYDLLKIIAIIQKYGNAAIHTQHTADFGDNELNAVIDALFDLYAFMFIEYFRKYPIEMNENVLTDFSLLPPIIRYKTFKYLYDKDKTNIYILDKLCLAMVKTYDRFTTVRWLEQNKVELEKILYPNDEKREAFVRNLGNYAEKIIETLPKNAYELCMNKIISIDDVIQVNGKMYEDFEEAKYYFETYRSKENVGLPKSMIDLHSIMNFVYLGRRKIEPDMK